MIINFNNEVELKEGDVVSTTTSNFPYDNCYGCFVNSDQLTRYAEVDVEYHHSD